MSKNQLQGFCLTINVFEKRCIRIFLFYVSLARWHHQFDGHEFEHIPGVGDGQGSLACCSPWGSKDSDTTEWLN